MPARCSWRVIVTVADEGAARLELAATLPPG